MKGLSIFYATALLLLACSYASTVPDDWPDVAAYIERVRWHPQGQWILFVRQGEDGSERRIYKVRPDGSGLIALSVPGSHDDLPIWSPDGQQIAFIRRGAPTEVYKMNADGTGVTSLGRHPGIIDLVRWLPDGRIVFIAHRGDGGPMLGTFRASTGEEERFWCDASDADWHPSGNYVVVSRLKGRPSMHANLHEIDLSTKQDRQLTFGVELDDSPRYSPDGEWIVFNTCRNKAGGRLIWLVRRDGTNLHPVPLPDGPNMVESDADFSPDGQYLAFARGEYGATDLYVCRVDGTDLRRITYFDRQAKANSPLKVVKDPASQGKASSASKAQPANKQKQKKSSGVPLSKP